MDLPAPKNTPVVAVEDGTIARLYEGTEGGIAVYQYESERHLRVLLRAPGSLCRWPGEGAPVKRGQVIGYVGTTGNAPAGTPQLHFAILALDDAKRWWNGTPVDPLAVLP